MTETNARPGRHGAGLSGRQAEAARNDQRILESARAVFVADPGAPITAVAKHAGVGISALYTRYGSKEELLRTLCTDGLQTFVQETEAAIERVRQGHDHWQVFAAFMQNLTDADTSSLTRAFAGKFAPTPEMFALANRSAELSEEFFGLTSCCTTSRCRSSWWRRSSSPTPHAPPSCGTGTWP
jgi:AcrR family transcriptional regulator